MYITLENILEKYNNPEYIRELEEKKKEYISNREKSKKHNKNISVEKGLINKKPPIKWW